MATKSEALFAAALAAMPGGVNSPVRAFNAVGGTPPFVERAEGAYLFDADGRSYIDYVGSWGPMIAGHAHPHVVEAVAARIRQGLSFGAPTEIETLLAQKICELVPTVEKVRMVSSGTEAAMVAIRLARGFTGRECIVKFEGCYHGHTDSLLVKAGSGALTLGVPTSPGVPAALAELTTTLPYNDGQAVRDLFDAIGADIAAIIVEPIAGNMNCILPAPDFLDALRSVTADHGAVLIFDEVMTGFRVHLGCAQSLLGVRPDLSVFGKVIGGGMPVGAVGGPATIMDQLSPAGPVYQAGTLSGNPVAMASGLATLELICAPNFHALLEAQTGRLCAGFEEAARVADVALTTNHVCGMFGIFFTQESKVTNFAQATACDGERFKRFFHAMLKRGVYLAPSPFEAGFVSSAHGDDEIERTVATAAEAFKAV